MKEILLMLSALGSSQIKPPSTKSDCSNSDVYCSPDSDFKRKIKVYGIESSGTNKIHNDSDFVSVMTSYQNGQVIILEGDRSN